MLGAEDENLKNLPPQERVKRLRELILRKQQELKEEAERRQQELEENEELLRESEEDLEEREEQELEERLKSMRRQLEELEKQERSLEQTVAEEEVQAGLNTGQYGVPQEQQAGRGPGGTYTPIGQIVDDLNALQYRSQWGAAEEELYQRRKEELSQTSQYRNTLSDDILEQVDMARNILKKLGYQTH